MASQMNERTRITLVTTNMNWIEFNKLQIFIHFLVFILFLSNRRQWTLYSYSFLQLLAFSTATNASFWNITLFFIFFRKLNFKCLILGEVILKFNRIVGRWNVLSEFMSQRGRNVVEGEISHYGKYVIIFYMSKISYVGDPPVRHRNFNMELSVIHCAVWFVSTFSYDFFSFYLLIYRIWRNFFCSAYL